MNKFIIPSKTREEAISFILERFPNSETSKSEDLSKKVLLAIRKIYNGSLSDRSDEALIDLVKS